MKNIGNGISIKDRNWTDKTEKAIWALKRLNNIILIIVLVISFLACIPDAKTVAGRHLFQRLGNSINAHSQSFFLVILILFCLLFVSLLIQLSLRKAVILTNISSIAKKMDAAFKQSDAGHKENVNIIHNLEIAFLEKEQQSLSRVEKSRNHFKIMLMETKSAYKDNLRNYYDSNKQIYIIVQNTQLNNIKVIKELIDTYCKLS